MGFDQYHEPPDELSQETRTRARMFAGLTEEAEAISWYEQRISIEQDPQARAVMLDAIGEEYKHFAMNLEYLLRRSPQWRQTAKGILFTDGDIVELGEAAEEAAGDDAPDDTSAISAPPPTGGSLGIGGLRSADR